jgi:myosin heavy subunit
VLSVVFPLNSLEQLCINYANEKLQFHFNEVIFHEETQMYLSEGISLEKVIFEDNSECVALIEGKPIGIFRSAHLQDAFVDTRLTDSPNV